VICDLQCREAICLRERGQWVGSEIEFETCPACHLCSVICALGFMICAAGELFVLGGPVGLNRNRNCDRNASGLLFAFCELCFAICDLRHRGAI
jgi:hypothetical protein